jgi:phage shock protein A
MTDLFKKLDTLLRAKLHEFVTEAPSNAAKELRQRLTPSQLGENFGPEVGKLREHVNRALDYETQLQDQLANAQNEVTRLDDLADQQVQAGRDADARYTLQQLQAAERRVKFLESDLQEHRRVTQDLLLQVNQLEAAQADAQHARNVQPSAQPAPEQTPARFSDQVAASTQAATATAHDPNAGRVPDLGRLSAKPTQAPPAEAAKTESKATAQPPADAAAEAKPKTKPKAKAGDQPTKPLPKTATPPSAAPAPDVKAPAPSAAPVSAEQPVRIRVVTETNAETPSQAVPLHVATSTNAKPLAQIDQAKLERASKALDQVLKETRETIETLDNTLQAHPTTASPEGAPPIPPPHTPIPPTDPKQIEADLAKRRDRLSKK